MNIREFGGEFALIQSIAKPPVCKQVLCGIGDDCAVIQTGIGKDLMVLGKDILVEGDHFSLEYFSPEEVGIKSAESNLSDIAAMGGFPQYALVGMVLPKDFAATWVQKFYQGLHGCLDRHHVDVVGGDTTHGKILVISITLLGKVEKDKICYRTGAAVGDKIRITGPLGASTAGYRLYKNKILGHEEVKYRHRNPQSRLDISTKIAEVATSMTDISDGLAADLGNILQQSHVGAVLYKDKIPVERHTVDAAAALGEDPYDYVFHGGEDFELVFTIPAVEENFPHGIEIGEITSKSGIMLQEGTKWRSVALRGYDHFC